MCKGSLGREGFEVGYIRRCVQYTIRYVRVENGGLDLGRILEVPNSRIGYTVT